MSEPWKVIVCSSEECQETTFDGDGNVRDGYHITPDIDTDYMTQFTCMKCGYVETWGPTRRMVAMTLYGRYSHTGGLQGD